MSQKIEQGLFSLKNLCLLCFALVFIACKEKTKIESYIPKEAKSIVKVDLPKLKDKLLTWENIKEHLFSGNKETKDFAIDFDRSIYAYSLLGIDKPILLLPITSASKFEEDIFETYSQEKLEKNGFSYLVIKGQNPFVIAWKEQIAFILRSEDQLETISESEEINPLLDALAKKDMAAILDVKLEDSLHSRLAFDIEFETGQLIAHFAGDANFKKMISENYLPETQKPTLCFTTDSCIFGLSTKVKPEVLDKVLGVAMPFLQEYGLMFSEQYEDIKTHLDGRIYIGVSQLKLAKGIKPEAKIAFGIEEGYTPNLSQMSLDVKTQYYVDKEDFQYIMPTMDYVIFSNHKESNTQLLKRNTFVNLQMNRSAINESFFTLPKLFFGRNVVESFHFSNLEIDVHNAKDAIELDGTIQCSDQEHNSIFCALELMQAINKQDEI